MKVSDFIPEFPRVNRWIRSAWPKFPHSESKRDSKKKDSSCCDTCATGDYANCDSLKK